jgi:hypothetical protein
MVVASSRARARKASLTWTQLANMDAVDAHEGNIMMNAR